MKITSRAGLRVMQSSLLTKTLRIMRMMAILLTAFCVQVSANSLSQTITFSGKDVPLAQVLQEVKRQTNFFVIYNSTQLKSTRPVSIDAQNMPLEVFMEQLMRNQPLRYSLKNTTIVIQRKEAEINAPTFNDVTAPPVTGKVLGPDGQPIAGANVIVKGTKRGTVTGADGGFTIEASNGEIIIISSIGFTAREVKIDGNLIGNLSLAKSDDKLDEVQIIAYGSTTRRLSTGNVSTVKSKDIEKQPVTNPLLALQGRATGIFINQNSGYTGGGVTVRIQGQNSIVYGNDPFYVVDGVPYLSQPLPGVSGILVASGGTKVESGATAGNPFSFLNPSDIESIEVLKDADATAIYGSRAANGAILITTKKGRVGQTKVDLTVQTGFAEVARKMELLNTQQYLEMRKEAYTNDGLAIPTPDDFKNYSNYDLTVFDRNRYTDWQKEVIGGSSNFTNGQLSISGGNAQTTFRINAGYHRQSTVLPKDFLDRKASLGLSLDHSSTNNKFKLTFSGNFQNDNNYLPMIDVTQFLLKLPPNAPALRNPDGSINWNRIEINPLTHDSVSTFNNPLALLEQTSRIKTTNLVSNLNLSYLLAKGLMLKTSFGYTDQITNDFTKNPITRTAPETRPFIVREGGYSDSRAASWIIEPQLNYNFNLNAGQASFLLGSTFQQNENNLKMFLGQGYNSDEVISNYMAASSLNPLNSIQSKYKYNAIFARLNYNWKEKYIINLTARRDGSSRYGSENRFQNFGAIGAAWLFSNENLLRDNFSFLSFGKIRASYGTTGSDQIPNYRYLNQYLNLGAPVPYQNSIGIAPDGIPNPYLQWELTKKLQGGIDLGFVGDRVLIGVNYFRNISSNQLLSYSLPYQTGVGDILQNFPAKIKNSGWEFSVSTINIRRNDFSWSTGINLTVNKNELAAFPGLETSPYATTLIIGKPINILKRYDFAGVNAETGVYQYKTSDGNLTAYPGSKDSYVAIDLNPRFYGGLQNNISYKAFNLDFLFQFVKQNAEMPVTGWGFQLGNNQNQPVGVLNRWQKQGDQTNIQKFSTFSLDFYSPFSSVSYGDASYVRLKNVSLSYDLPGRLIKVIHLDRFRIFAQGQNLLTFSDYKGLDPETPGVYTLPPLRTVTFGVQVNF